MDQHIQLYIIHSYIYIIHIYIFTYIHCISPSVLIHISIFEKSSEPSLRQYGLESANDKVTRTNGKVSSLQGVGYDTPKLVHHRR